jgi:MFS family permease
MEDDNLKKPQGEEPFTVAVFLAEAKLLKWRVLIVACFLTFGSYYIYDFPGSIGTGPKNTIQKRFDDHYGKGYYSQEMNQVLYSVYSWPNTVLAVFGGLLIDKYLGLRRAMLLFTGLVFAGSAVFYIGVVAINYPLLIFARVLFGLGGESLSVAQSAFVARWFKGGRGMALAFGITISFSRVGSSFNFLFSPMIAKDKDINTAVMAGMLACCVSLLACFVLILADRYAVNVGYIKAEAHENQEDAMNLRDIFKLPKELWVICTICVFCYTSIFPFIGIGKNFFEVKYDYSGDEASRYISIYQFTSAGASPVVGALVDGIGRNTLWLILASACFILTHLMFIVTNIPAAVMMATMGVFYSFLVSGLWPSVPWVVPENMVGFSYGVMTALQNAGLAIFPLITGAVLDHYMLATPINGTNTTNGTHSFMAFLEDTNASDSSSSGALPELEGYKMTEILFMISAGISLSASVLLLIFDQRGSGVLTARASERRALAAKAKESDPLLNQGDGDL